MNSHANAVSVSHLVAGCCCNCSQATFFCCRERKIRPMKTTLHSSSILAESQDNNFTRVILCMVRSYVDSNMATDPLAKRFLVASMTKATGA